MSINSSESLQKLVDVMEKLLAPGGCPWDREQTHKTLAPYAIEEAYELAEAIQMEDSAGIKEELGDFMFQAIFHSALGARDGKFTLAEVIDGVSEKLIRRHPHVFAATQVKDSDEVIKNWDEIKKAEKKAANKPKKTFDIPLALPSLQRSQKIGDKTKTLKFDWTKPSEVLEKLHEEVTELEEAIEIGKLPEIQEEMGDVFFVLAQLARHLKFDAETAARNANLKFEKRFEKMLALAEKQNLVFAEMTTQQKEELWQEIKKS